MRSIDGDKLVSIFANKKEEWRGKRALPSNESLIWLAAMDIAANIPTIDAVPLDKLCEWMADNVYLKDDTGGAWEFNSDNWKKMLTKWMDVEVNHESNGEH